MNMGAEEGHQNWSGLARAIQAAWRIHRADPATGSEELTTMPTNANPAGIQEHVPQEETRTSAPERRDEEARLSEASTHFECHHSSQGPPSTRTPSSNGSEYSTPTMMISPCISQSQAVRDWNNGKIKRFLNNTALRNSAIVSNFFREELARELKK